MTLLGDLGSTITMEDGSKLRLEVEKNSMLWTSVTPFVVGYCLVHSGNVNFFLRNRVVRYQTYIVDKDTKFNPKNDNISCQNLKSKSKKKPSRCRNQTSAQTISNKSVALPLHHQVSLPGLHTGDYMFTLVPSRSLFIEVIPSKLK